jgi:hypothetical protein
VRKRLTKRTLKSLTPRERTFFVWDTDVTGFGLKVTPAGHRTYVFQYRLPGRGRSSSAKRITIGKTADITLDKAQAIAANYLLDVKAGGDPALAKKRGDVPTVVGLADVFLKEYLPTKKRPPRPSTLGDYASLFKCHVVPRIGSKRVEEVTTSDIEQLHASMRSKPYVANRTLSVLQQAFDQAERWGWRPQQTNPVRHIERYPEERRGARKQVMLSPEQMRDLLAAIDFEEAHGTPSTAHVSQVVSPMPLRLSKGQMLGWSGATGVTIPEGAVHLHLELKFYPVLGSSGDDTGPWGWASQKPNLIGFINPFPYGIVGLGGPRPREALSGVRSRRAARRRPPQPAPHLRRRRR